MRDVLKGIRRFSFCGGLYGYGGPRPRADGDYVSARRAAQVIRADRATIARLTAERDEARASAAAAYERAAAVSGEYMSTEADVLLCDMWREDIRALSTESESNALAEIVKKAVDAETRACADAAYKATQPELPPEERWILEEQRDNCHAAILARIDQRKEGV